MGKKKIKLYLERIVLLKPLPLLCSYFLMKYLSLAEMFLLLICTISYISDFKKIVTVEKRTYLFYKNYFKLLERVVPCDQQVQILKHISKSGLSDALDCGSIFGCI